MIPAIDLEGWWTSLADEATTVIELYQHHGLHEQYHSEFKTDLDLERLPSGKFDTNDAILQLAAFAYNGLRLIGQLGLTGDIAPIRHPAKRRRIRTVLQEIMYRAAKFVAHARRLVLDFGRGGARRMPQSSCTYRNGYGPLRDDVAGREDAKTARTFRGWKGGACLPYG